MSRSHRNIATSAPTCPECDGAEFALRILRDEAVAAARCVNCSQHYLLLDSGDYWFDVIQKGYPRLVRCSCKNESFRLSIDYSFRDDGDIDHIRVGSTCSACSKTRRRLNVEVDYSPTDRLLKEPLVPVKNPKVLYDLKDLNLLVTLPDITRVIGYLGTTCSFVSCVRTGDRWVLRSEDAAGVNATIESARYLFIYAMPFRIDVPEYQATTQEDAFWKRSEVIRLGPKSHVCSYSLGDNPSRRISHRSDAPTGPGDTEIGLSFDITFSNEFVSAERIVSKSTLFRTVTAGLMAELQKALVSWRGPHCFDNPEVNVRIFGDRFRKRGLAKKQA